MIIRVIDFETTGIPTQTEKHAICEVGWCDVDTDRQIVGGPVSMLCNPGRTMPADALAVHHITDADVADCAGPDTAIAAMVSPRPDAWCAHNARYEQDFFTGADLPWICTRKVGMRLWPDAPNHQNQTLRYYLGIELDSSLAMPPHRAGPDAYVTAHILLAALSLASIEELIEWSSGHALLPSVTFGKHRGRRWSELPWDYLDWIVRKSDLDGDTKFTAKHELQRREAERV